MELLYKVIPSLLDGTKTTILVFILVLILSLPLSILICILRQYHHTFINIIIDFYIYIERGTPLLLQLMFIFFGLPYLGIVMSRELSIGLAFTLNYSAYFAEILRGGINAIDKGQFESSKVLGFSYFYTLKSIILPQAFRNSLPSIGNEVLSLVKDTSLIYILGASELLKAGRGAVNTYASAIPFIYVAIIYLLISAICSLLLKIIEKKISYYV